MINNVTGVVNKNLNDIKCDLETGDLYIIGYNSPITSNYYFLKINRVNPAEKNLIEHEETNYFNIGDGNDCKNYTLNANLTTVTLFETYDDAKSVVNMLFDTVKIKPDVLQIKNICEQYYCITHYQETLNDIKTSKEWHFNPRGYTQRSSINSNYTTVMQYYFKLNDYDNFVTKLRECKLDCINILHNKILEIQQHKAEYLLS